MLTLPCLLRERYRVDRLIGEGGFGTLYQGQHIVLDVPVAIKLLRLPTGGSREDRGELVTRFLEEGRVLARLRHPHIVAALDVDLLPAGEDGERVPFMVMEWVEGVSLRALLQRRGRLSLEEAWALFEPLAEGVAFAHRARVVHRDLKPENVMVVTEASGQLSPRVVDFGIAKLVDPEDESAPSSVRTTSGYTAFTPAYAAPEQMTQSRTGPWTDVHALGLLLVEMLTGARPYGEGPEARLAVVDAARPGRGVGGVLAGVIAKAVALRGVERFADAGEMLVAARAVMGTARVRGAALASSPSESPPEPAGTALVGTEAAPASTQDSFGMGAHTEGSRSFPVNAALAPATMTTEPGRGARLARVLVGGSLVGALALGLVVWRGRTTTPLPIVPVSSFNVAPTTPSHPPYVAPVPSTHLAELVDRALLLVKRGDADDEARALLERVPIEAPSLEKRAPEDNRRVGMASLLLGRLSERRAKAPARTTVATVATADEALLDHYNELVRLYAQTPISMDTLSCGQLGMARATEYYRAASEAMAAQLADDLRKHGDNAALDGKTYLVIFESRGVAQDKQALLTVEGALTIGAAGRDPVDETDCVAALQKLRGDLRAKLGK